MLSFPSGATIERYPDRESWLAARRCGIGASTMGSLWAPEIEAIESDTDEDQGGTYGTPYSVWCDLSGFEVAGAVNERMVIGSCLERGIAQLYAELHQRSLIDLGRHTIVRHPTLSWALASLDFVVDADPQGLCEAKNVGDSRLRHLWSTGVLGEGGRAPLKFVIQAQHQLLVTGLEWCDLFALIGGGSSVCVRVRRDESLTEQIIAKGEDMMRRVRDADPPEVDGHEATREAQRARFAEHRKDHDIDLDESAAELLAQRADLIKKRDHYDLEARRIEAVLVERVGEHHHANVPGWGRITAIAARVDRVAAHEKHVRRSLRFPPKPTGRPIAVHS